MKFKKGDLVEVIWRSELYRGTVVRVVEATDEIKVKLAKKPAIDYLFNQNRVRKVKLVKVPQFVADVIRIWKEKWGDDLAASIDYKLYTEQFVHEWSFDERIRGWLQYAPNQELFARAWLDGYEVEQELLYYVRFPLTFWDEDKAELEDIYRYLRLNVTSDETEISGRTTVSEWQKADGWRTQLTEKQIKDMNENYWAFRVPLEEVEGGVK
ncbi:DUF1642 domain-containing protein [Listeria monocytogenes]|nr:DUF1642 domain-containing protein [Listeria monocytogenes]